MKRELVSKKIATIGFGNTLRGDDALGVVVVNALRELLERDGAPLLKSGSLVLKAWPLLEIGHEEELADCSAIVMVDACENGEGVQVREVGAGTNVSSLTSHLSSPQTLVTLLEILYGHRPRTYLVAVAGKEFNLKEGLSAAAEANARAAVAALLDLIDRIASSPEM